VARNEVSFLVSFRGCVFEVLRFFGPPKSSKVEDEMVAEVDFFKMVEF